MNDKPYLSLVTPWRITEGRELARTRIFTVRTRHGESTVDPERSGEFTYLDSPDWCNVIAVEGNDIVMIEQFRHGTAEITLELPGGVIDPGEDPADACRRELLEETGYAGDPVQMIGSVAVNPAMQNNRCHFGLIRNAKRVGDQRPDEHEEIGVRLVPRDHLRRLVVDNVIRHSLIVAALYRYEILTD